MYLCFFCGKVDWAGRLYLVSHMVPCMNFYTNFMFTFILLFFCCFFGAFADGENFWACAVRQKPNFLAIFFISCKNEVRNNKYTKPNILNRRKWLEAYRREQSNNINRKFHGWEPSGYEQKAAINIVTVKIQYSEQRQSVEICNSKIDVFRHNLLLNAWAAFPSWAGFFSCKRNRERGEKFNMFAMLLNLTQL